MGQPRGVGQRVLAGEERPALAAQFRLRRGRHVRAVVLPPDPSMPGHQLVLLIQTAG
jgi:hypothetical protein